MENESLEKPRENAENSAEKEKKQLLARKKLIASYGKLSGNATDEDIIKAVEKEGGELARGAEDAADEKEIRREIPTDEEVKTFMRGFEPVAEQEEKPASASPERPGAPLKPPEPGRGETAESRESRDDKYLYFKFRGYTPDGKSAVFRKTIGWELFSLSREECESRLAEWQKLMIDPETAPEEKEILQMQHRQMKEVLRSWSAAKKN